MGKHNRIVKKSKFKTTKGIEYKVLFRKPDARWFQDADGYCQDPNTEEPKIVVNPYLTDQSELNTIIQCTNNIIQKPETTIIITFTISFCTSHPKTNCKTKIFCFIRHCETLNVRVRFTSTTMASLDTLSRKPLTLLYCIFSLIFSKFRSEN